jgi:hypothetical protein
MTPAGWYADPEDSNRLRWWDGKQWTTNVRATQEQARAVPPPTPAAARPAAGLPAEVAELRREYEMLKSVLVETRDLIVLQEVGIYQYSHPLENAVAYKERLDQLSEAMKKEVKEGTAVAGTTQWVINGSQKEGAKMVSDFCKLMLRAYNNEADNLVRGLKPYKLESAVQRLEKTREAIQKLGASMKICVGDTYHKLRVTELQLTADYLAKREEEKEREREERARLKEEEAVQRELEREQGKLEKERSHYEAVLAAMRAKGNEAAAAEAEAKVAEIENAITGLEERAANIRAGYVYCISNIGAFGPNVIKIGLTRRLDPEDRVRELGDASVPFKFDTHAIVFSEDAVGLETALHHRFADKRVNMVNARREFFYVTPAEVRVALEDAKASLISFEEAPEAVEWRQSEHVRKTGSLEGKR